MDKREVRILYRIGSDQSKQIELGQEVQTKQIRADKIKKSGEDDFSLRKFLGS